MFNPQEWLVFCLVFFLVFWLKKKSVSNLADKIPGPNGVPYIGVIYKFIGVKGGGSRSSYENSEANNEQIF